MTLPSRSDRKVVVDTNVILFDALAINKFRSADIYIPLSVIEEIDRFKRDLGENGRNARQFSRFVDVLRGQGSLAEGVLLEKTGSHVYVLTDFTFKNLPPELNMGLPDNRILGVALALQMEKPSASVELITKDINLRIKADVFDIDARDYDPENTQFDAMYTGFKELELAPDQIDRFYREKNLDLGEDHRMFANQYAIMKDQTNPNHSAIGRYDGKLERIVPLISPSESIWGIHPRNMEQSFALDALLNDEILFVSLVGKAGTGKTLLALAAGLYKTLDEGALSALAGEPPDFPHGPRHRLLARRR